MEHAGRNPDRQQQPPPAPRGGGHNAAYARGNMSNFREIVPADKVRKTYVAAPLPVTFTAEVITAQPNHIQFSEMTYKAILLNYEQARDDLLDDNKQRAAYVFGIILNVIHGIKMEILEELLKNGMELEELRIPNVAGDRFLEVPPEPMDVRKAFVLFGYAVIMLFKNVTEVNFPQFTTNRFKALKAIANYDGDDDIPLFDNAAQAISYKKLFGGVPKVRQIILNGVLQQTTENTLFGGVCSYVARILQWTDMGGVVFIHQTLLLTNSPVLTAPEVAAEVRNLAVAYHKVIQAETPQYFRIYCDNNDYRLLDRNNFPILMAVAQVLKADNTPSLAQFEYSMPAISPVVQRLADLHRAHFTAHTNANLQTLVNFLTETRDEHLED